MKAESTRPIEYVDLDGSVIKHLTIIFVSLQKERKG